MSPRRIEDYPSVELGYQVDDKSVEKIVWTSIHMSAFSRRELPGLRGVPASRLGNWLDRLHLRELKARWSVSWPSDDILIVSINTRRYRAQLLERIVARLRAKLSQKLRCADCRPGQT